MTLAAARALALAAVDVSTVRYLLAAPKLQLVSERGCPGDISRGTQTDGRTPDRYVDAYSDAMRCGQFQSVISY